MRAVEKTPWAERRSSMHDAICLLVAENARRVLDLAAPAVADLIGAVNPPRSIDDVTVEAECGVGFCDVLIQTDGRTRAWFVEVKTDDEKWSAGDVIRQLRWYAKQRGGRFEQRNLVLVVETLPPPHVWMLLLRGGVRVEPKWTLERKATGT